MLQHAHRGVRERGFVPKEGGVYCSRWSYGSPGHKYGVRATVSNPLVSMHHWPAL